MKPILEVANIRKSFGALQAIDDISFTLNESEILGIAGPNGSGKSTLFNVLTKIPFGPDSGEIRLGSESITRCSPRQIVEKGLVRIFQTEMDFESLSVLDNIRVSVPYGKGNRAERLARASELLDFFDLSSQMNRQAGEISVYDRKRLMLATAYAHNPRVLLLDEPAAGLSNPEVEAMIALVQKLNKSGVSIIIIEHIIPLLVALSNRLIVLNFGEVMAEGIPSDIVRDPKVIEAYLGSSANE